MIGAGAVAALLTTLGISVLHRSDSGATIIGSETGSAAAFAAVPFTAAPSAATSVVETAPEVTIVTSSTAPTVSNAPSTVPIDKTAVRVRILNMSGKNGVGAQTVKKLEAAGWAATAEQARLSAVAYSVVYFDVGKQEEALAISAALGISNAAVLAASDGAPWTTFAESRYDVLVLAGKDLR